MLKGIPDIISPDLLYILASMGHGDRLVIADEYYPAQSMTDSKRVVYAKGHDAKTIIDAIVKILPLDIDFCEAPIRYMVSDDCEVVDQYLPVHEEVIKCLIEGDIKEEKIRPIRRSDFYLEAKSSFATVSTGEKGAYGCFILHKGLN
ncbi:RbsD/FucU family protein [Peptoniphilaceae bacterium SGI.131]